MRKWKCVEGNKVDFIVGKIYESDDDGFGFIGEDSWFYYLKHNEFVGVKFEEVFGKGRIRK